MRKKNGKVIFARYVKMNTYQNPDWHNTFFWFMRGEKQKVTSVQFVTVFFIKLVHSNNMLKRFMRVGFVKD